jgi:undecaprenyl-diphosphatase
LHGPAELAPVSSSAHTTLVAWRRGWRLDDLDPQTRKRFELALHAGAAAATLLARREPRTVSRRVVVAACVPPALAGALLRGPIERHLGTPATIAAALAAGGAAMAVAEHARGGRARQDARLADGLALGGAQALALIPGVSRSGAARAVARMRGFDPREAQALSDAIGIPITLAAVASSARAARGADRDTLALGAAAAFASTLASGALLRRVGAARSLYPFALYRVALAAAVVRRLRENGAR